MESTARNYNVLIYPCSETGETPSSQIHMEVAGDFKAFYEDAMKWIRVFHESRHSEEKGEDARFRVHDNEGKEDIPVRCDEAEIILSLLYCCQDHEVHVREICYQGNSYTDISDIRFSNGFVANRERYANIFRTNIRLRAKKNGLDIKVYLFGPELFYNAYDELCCNGYPLSHGMVEIDERQMCYAGTYIYWCHEEEEDLDFPENTLPKIYDYDDGVEVFFETDGKSITFSALMDGKLYKKIHKDDEKVVFYSALCEGALLDHGRYYYLNQGGKRSFWEYRDVQDVVFKRNSDGEYRYVGDNKEVAERWSGAAFVPPQTAGPGNPLDNPLLLCRLYIMAFYEKRPAQLSEEPETDENSEEPETDANSEDKKIWAEFRKILGNIHAKYGLTAAEKAAFRITAANDEVSPAEILYAACKFFSLEKKELEELFTTEELRKEYGVLKTAAEDVLNLCADPDVAIFGELCEIFARDFSYINRITIPWNKKDIFIPIPDDDVQDGTASEYDVILTMVAYAGKLLYKPNTCEQRDFLSIIKYYRTNKTEDESAKKEIDTVIALRKRLRAGLQTKVKGQDMAVEKFVDGYIRYQLRGKVPGKPAGLYLFAGPPGTGKTYLAETFVGLKDMRDAGYCYKRFDMSAYGSENSDIVTGLVGFEKTWKSAQPGQLTDFVKKNPKCVLLFDEIEKASLQVRFLFLSILEGAVLTDKYYNEQVSFEDAILIFTTNEGKDLYEDNRETNLTALPDSAVIEGLQASKFAPELISRFMSGTIVMFNHLDYFNMSSIFEHSVNTAAAQICRNQEGFHFDLSYDDKLPKLYLLSKGDRIDARFVSANAQKTVENYFLEAAEFMGRRCAGRLKEIKKATVSVEVTETIRKYFEMTERPRILLYAEGDAGVYIGDTARLRSGFLPEKGLEELGQMADCDRAEMEGSEKEPGKSFREFLQSCNWNSHNRTDRYDAILIDLGNESKNYKASEGYKCLTAAAEAKPDIPIILVDRGTVEDKAPLLSLGVTDFVRAVPYEPQHTDRNNPTGLALDGKELEAILGRQHFVEMARALVREGKRLSGDVAYDYKEESDELEIRFIDLRETEAATEDAEARRQNRKYLLAEKPQVRLRDIFGNELVREAVNRCIDNIKNPEKYRAMGAKLMTGILMYGAPGMGKTMFAKAMAFESGAAFISSVGADFLNGDGVAKMEEMFQTARRKRPCVLFIDEFDAISKDRRGPITSGQENVLEKFLKEMDGLETDNDGVYVVAATNYPLEWLDEAIIRRFSARIHFPYPDMEERLRFLLHVLEKKNLKDKVSKRAARTLSLKSYGTLTNYSEIETFVEESIAEAVYKNESVTERFLLNRIHNETDGAARQHKDPREYIATAFHEAGHVVLQYHYGMEIDYVTIVSRGMYGGYAMGRPRYHTGQNLLDRICISFAGRIAETIYAGKELGINIGAGSDLQNATHTAYDYVCRYGMGNRIMVIPERFASQTGAYPEGVLPESEKEAIWASVNQILNQQWSVTIQHLRKYWDEVVALAHSLIYMQELVGEKAEEVIRSKTPHIEETCFLDADNDYMRTITVGAEAMVPFGYAVYPYYPYSQIRTQPEQEDMPETDGRHYFYAVKKGEKPLGISDNLQEAFATAYEQGANCRRFVSQEAAQRYLDMLELKAFRQGENRFCGFYADALSEMIDSQAVVKDLIILKEGEIGWYQVKTDQETGVTHLAMLKREYTDWHREKAAEAGMPFSLYLIEELAERFLEEQENAYRVIQIYDKALQEELLYYMGAMEYQAKRYRRNLGYKD
nr:AAA family ATPase [uncultured Acetatifactor sp.]